MLRRRMTGHEILVLAGTNGAGKSSVAGAALRQAGGEYFNPDEATTRYAKLTPHGDLAEANSLAWHEGRRRLEQAIAERRSFRFETTLGGRTITELLIKASNVGLPVRMLYVGLESPELHQKRVASRVLAGGHAIPKEKVIQRFEDSRANLIRLLPHLAELKVFDNSAEADPKAGLCPSLRLLLHVRQGSVRFLADLSGVPDWSKPIVLQALKLFRPAP